MSDGEEIRSVADYDAEIAELTAERDRLQGLLADPEQCEARRTRREQLAGRWRVGSPLSAEHVSAIREVSDDGESWLWDPDVLNADGWEQGDDGSWVLPSRGERS